MRWLLVKTGGRKYRCIDCDGPDPLKSSATLNLPEPLKSLERLQSHAQKAREDLEKLPPGEKRNALVHKICEIQRAIDFNRD
jgi:hypothetical protein